MDKLELDERVSRLERLVTILGASLLVLVVVNAGLLLYALRGGGRPPDAAVRIPAPPLPPAPPIIATVERPRTAYVEAEHPESEIVQLGRELVVLEDLWNRGAITSGERDAKKARLVDRPFAVGDYQADLLTVHELWNKNLISSDQRERLKAKILEAAN